MERSRVPRQRGSLGESGNTEEKEEKEPKGNARTPTSHMCTKQEGPTTGGTGGIQSPESTTPSQQASISEAGMASDLGSGSSSTDLGQTGDHPTNRR